MTYEELLEKFTPAKAFLFLYGGCGPHDSPSNQMKLCLTSTRMEPMARALYEISQREDFEGFALPLFRLLGFPGATRKMFRENLRGLKKLAERSV